MELIDRQALLKQIGIDSDGEPGYYGDTWKFIDTIKSMPSATDTNVGAKLSTNLAEVGTDCISRQAVMLRVREFIGNPSYTEKILVDELNGLPPAQPTFDARDTQYNLPIGTDLISRQAAIDDIWTVSPLARLDRKWVDRWLRQLPSAQPEIIRCRECKFASGDSRICMKFDHSPIGELDFCSFAERREVTT